MAMTDMNIKCGDVGPILETHSVIVIYIKSIAYTGIINCEVKGGIK